MTSECSLIANEHRDRINELIDIQVDENREAIFFFFEDGSTSDVFRGKATQISLTREEEASIMSQGEIVGSVHTHPSGLDPSTIDIMTGVMTQQERMCVAVPVHNSDIQSNFVLTCLDLSNLSIVERRRFIGAMRRSSVGISGIGQEFRKQAALQRFKVSGCRTETVKVDGIQYPAADRPSHFEFTIGRKNIVEGADEDVDFIDEL